MRRKRTGVGKDRKIEADRTAAPHLLDVVRSFGPSMTDPNDWSKGDEEAYQKLTNEVSLVLSRDPDRFFSPS